MDEGQGIRETVGRELRSKRLACMGWVDHEGLARKILLLVVLGVDPRGDALLIFGRDTGDSLDGQS